MPYGAFVEFLPGKQGLLHISEVSWKRLETMDGVLNEGDMVKVKLIGVDNKTGKFKLSRKILMPKPEGARPEGGRPEGNRPEGPRPEGSREGRPEIRPQRQENKE
jgi:polyribonucleotide nucleotidyltransferase